MGVYTLGVYRLGVYGLERPILDLGNQTPTHWGVYNLESTNWACTIWECTISIDQFWICGPAHLGVNSLDIYNLGVLSLERPILDFGYQTATHLEGHFLTSWESVYRLGCCDLAVYNLERPIVDLGTHSPGSLQSGSPQSRATDSGFRRRNTRP